MTDSSPDIWAGVATQYVGAWGQAAPMVQVAAIVAMVIVVAILARAWSRKTSRTDTGIPVEAFAHVVEEQARQTEALRSAVEGLSEIVHEMRKLLAARTFCPFPSPLCVPGKDDHD
jgi:hypothetical protein